MRITYDQNVDALYIRFKRLRLRPSIWVKALLRTTMPMDVWQALKFSTP